MLAFSDWKFEVFDMTHCYHQCLTVVLYGYQVSPKMDQIPDVARVGLG